MTADAALCLVAALEAAKSALEADYPELRTELERDVFRGNELRNTADKVRFYTGPDCLATPARKSAGLAEAIAGLLSLKTRIESFDGEALLAEAAARQSAIDAQESARQAAIDSERNARSARHETARVAYNATTEELGRLSYALNTYSMEDALRDGPEMAVAYCDELKADMRLVEAKRDRAIAEMKASKS